MNQPKPQSAQRSYSLDFLKFLLTLIIFWNHTRPFVGSNTKLPVPQNMGFWGVHAFFVISGLLMTAHFFKRDVSDNSKSPAVKTVGYIKSRVKGIAYPYFAAWIIAFIGYVVINKMRGLVIPTFEMFIRSIPEILFLNMAGVSPPTSDYSYIFMTNGATWYISAMFFAMVFLYYMLSRSPEFFTKIFAPLGAIVSYAYILHLKNPYISQNYFGEFFSQGAVRAFCGICFGVVAYDIYIYISAHQNNTRQRILFTVAELFIYLNVIYFWLIVPSNTIHTMFPVMLLLPIGIAITFSGQSYTAELFKHRFFKVLAPLSLAIYLTHDATPLRVVMFLLPGRSYKFSVAVMLGLTIAIIPIYFALIKLLKICVKKFRGFIAKPNKTSGA